MTCQLTGEPTSLGTVLAYRHSGVIRRNCKEQGASPEKGEELFREMLKWLYLCYRYALDERPHGFACSMTPELLQLDEMWHCFVLHTRDYADFCDTHFGFFLHHEPQSDEEGDAPHQGNIENELTEQLTFTHEVLGEETLRGWYEECRYA
jgi:hypothetical protein